MTEATNSDAENVTPATPQTVEDRAAIICSANAGEGEAIPESADYFKDFREHNSDPSLRLSEVQKIRYSEMAEDLEKTRVQAYIEANFGIQALNLLKSVVPLLAGLV